MPPTLNEQINDARSSRYKSATEKKNWTTIVAAIAHNQCKDEGWERFTAPVWLEFTWHTASKKWDPDNVHAAAKYVMDGLVLAKIIKGDSLAWIESPVTQWYRVDPVPGVTLRIANYRAFF